jgi:NAD(P)-dependent dehydrogenase (short-subunit alcohol dehydrogenase family)
MIAAGHGRIVTIASIAGLRGFGYSAPYVAAKHGAVGLMRALAAEYTGEGVTANAVCPGFADTEIVAQAVRTIRAKTGRDEEAARAELARFNPAGRLIAPEEVARAVVDLVLSGRNGEAVEIA